MNESSVPMQTAEQINVPQTGRAFGGVSPELKPSFELDPKKIPMPKEGKNPMRFAIRGVVHLIPDLKAFIEAQDFDPDLKTYILSELDELKTNAAEIHLHDIEFGEGEGFDLHLSVRARHLGDKKDSVFKREEKS